MNFDRDLKIWRGKRLQKEVTDIIGVPLETYKKWEQGFTEPSDLAKEQARWRMAADESGVSMQIYKARYFQIIHSVAKEILSRNF